MAQDNPHGERETGAAAVDATPPGEQQPSSGPADGSTGTGAAEQDPWARPGAEDAGPPEEQQTGSNAVAEQPVAEQPVAEQPVAEQPGSEGPTGQYPVYGFAPHGQYPQYPPYGQYGPYPGPTHPVPGFGAAPYPQYPGGPGGYPGPVPGSGPSRRNRIVGLVAAGAVLALVAGGIGGAVGADIARPGGGGVGSGGVISEPLPDVDSDTPVTPVEQVASRVLPSVVQLRVEGGTLARGQLGEGSGMVVSGDGLVLTNNHVVEPAASGGTLRAVFQDGRTAPVRIIGRDPESDIALVKADNVAGLTPVELGNSDGVRVGQPVTAFGSPLGLGGSVTSGIVSALNRAVSVGGGEAGAVASETVLSALQTDAAINPGNSGGPLVDMQGRVVGINSAIATAGPGGGSIGVGFSIPVNQAKRIADQLRTGGRATHAVLGVEVSDDPSKTGALLRSVEPNGAAARAGLKPGDLVVRLGNQPITGGTELQAAVRSQAPGATVDVQLVDRTIRVTLGEK